MVGEPVSCIIQIEFVKSPAMNSHLAYACKEGSLKEESIKKWDITYSTNSFIYAHSVRDALTLKITLHK